MRIFSSDPVVKLGQLEFWIQELKINQRELNSQANTAKQNASKLIIEAAEKESQAQVLNGEISELERQLKKAQGELSLTERQALKNNRIYSENLVRKIEQYNSDLDFLLQVAHSSNGQEMAFFSQASASCEISKYE